MCDPIQDECQPIDPPCASEIEIDTYIDKKQARLKIINDKIDFDIKNPVIR